MNRGGKDPSHRADVLEVGPALTQPSSAVVTVGRKWRTAETLVTLGARGGGLTPGSGQHIEPPPASCTCPAGLEQACWTPLTLTPTNYLVPCRSVACYKRGQCCWLTTSSYQEHQSFWHMCVGAAALSAHTSPPTWSTHRWWMAWRRLSTWAQAARHGLDHLPCSGSLTKRLQRIWWICCC